MQLCSICVLCRLLSWPVAINLILATTISLVYLLQQNGAQIRHLVHRLSIFIRYVLRAAWAEGLQIMRCCCQRRSFDLQELLNVNKCSQSRGGILAVSLYICIAVEHVSLSIGTMRR
jgi:hypothetical protein